MNSFLQSKHFVLGSEVGDADEVTEVIGVVGSNVLGVERVASSPVASSVLVLECCPQFQIGFLSLLAFAERSLHIGFLWHSSWHCWHCMGLDACVNSFLHLKHDGRESCVVGGIGDDGGEGGQCMLHSHDGLTMLRFIPLHLVARWQVLVHSMHFRGVSFALWSFLQFGAEHRSGVMPTLCRLHFHFMVVLYCGMPLHVT